MESLSMPDSFLEPRLEPRLSTELATSRQKDGKNMEEFQEDALTFWIWLKVFLVSFIFLIFVVIFPLRWIIAAIIAILISAILVRDPRRLESQPLTHSQPRFLYLRRARYTKGRDWITVASNGMSIADLRSLPAVYMFFVLGSGGHTSEMMDIIQWTCRCSKNVHRRYLYTAGDKHSRFAVARLECQITNAYFEVDRGTWDQFEVPRARRVHQSWWTTPLSCIWSAFYGVMALTRHPEKRPVRRHGDQYCIPHVLVTNGPGTGFVMAVIAYVLKLLCLVPATRLKVVYIETWAHVHTLSLTGKLFHWTNLADLFVVQHQQLAEKYGHMFVGGLVGHWNGRWWDDESANVGGTRGQASQAQGAQ